MIDEFEELKMTGSAQLSIKILMSDLSDVLTTEANKLQA